MVDRDQSSLKVDIFGQQQQGIAEMVNTEHRPATERGISCTSVCTLHALDKHFFPEDTELLMRVIRTTLPF